MLQRYVIDSRLPLYVYAVLVAFGAALGRAICGWICPFGLIQDLLDKVSLHKYTPPQWMRGIKFAFLGGVVLMALTTSTIFWCRYLCFGALLGVIPYWLTWQTVSAFWLFYHLGIFAAYVAFSYMTHGRAWCRYFCPLGAILAILNPIAIVVRRYNKKTCISCGKCKEVCPMDLQPIKNDWRSKIDCIKCGRCVKVCPPKSLQISTSFSGGFRIDDDKAVPKPQLNTSES
jgi:polyferredoxin